jgi:hypothetical protein
MVAWPVRPLITRPEVVYRRGRRQPECQRSKCPRYFLLYLVSQGKGRHQVAAKEIGREIDTVIGCCDNRVDNYLFPALSRKASLEPGRVASENSRKEAP